MIHADLALARRHERAASAIESEYARSHAAIRPRGSAAKILVCPLADDSLFAALNQRGYRLAEFEQVMVRVLDDGASTRRNSEIEITAIERGATIATSRRWVRTSREMASSRPTCET